MIIKVTNFRFWQSRTILLVRYQECSSGKKHVRERRNDSARFRAEAAPLEIRDSLKPVGADPSPEKRAGTKRGRQQRRRRGGGRRAGEEEEEAEGMQRRKRKEEKGAKETRKPEELKED